MLELKHVSYYQKNVKVFFQKTKSFSSFSTKKGAMEELDWQIYKNHLLLQKWHNAAFKLIYNISHQSACL